MARGRGRNQSESAATRSVSRAASAAPTLSLAGRTSWELQQIAGVSPPELARYAALEERLKAVGGERMLFTLEDDLEQILEHGQAFEAAGAIRRKGRVSSCHSNVARLAEAGKARIATGYALNEGLWRQHSWGISPGGKVIETTEPREAYFGILLEGEAAEDFIFYNV